MTKGPRLHILCRMRHFWTGSFLSGCLWNLDKFAGAKIRKMSKFEQLMFIFLSKWLATAWGVFEHWPLALFIFWGFFFGRPFDFFDHVDGKKLSAIFFVNGFEIFRKVLFRSRRRGWNDIMNPSNYLLNIYPDLEKLLQRTSRTGQMSPNCW